MYLIEELEKKWGEVLDHGDLPKISNRYKRAVTAVMLENQLGAMKEEGAALGRPNMLNEGAPTNFGGGLGAGNANLASFDPILISLVRRSLPNLIAYDIAGVQPMTGPTGLIFAMRTRYNTQSGTEAFYNEPNTDFTGATYLGADTATNPVANLANANAYTTGVGLATVIAESLGDGSNNWNQMAFSIERVSVTAKTRALKAEYTLELAQDLKAIHGLDAETELSNILSTEILAEINREVVRTIYYVANPGAQYGTTTPGIFDLDTDSNGRWMAERFKGLIFQIERECNGIAKDTRRGKGNTLIVSSDVASAMAMTGVLSYTPSLNASLTVDDTGNTYAGMLHGRIKVYIDPYFGGSASGTELLVAAYKGSSPYDAGLFYCPYVPLQMVRAVGQDTFQPKIGFKTRYGLVANPFAQGTTQGLGALNARSNLYYRIMGVKNLM